MYRLLCAIIRRVQLVEAVFGFCPGQVIQNLAALQVPLGLVRQEVADVDGRCVPTM
jgi:hypothetical protein